MILSHYGWMGCVLALAFLQACAIVNPKGIQYAPDETITSALAPVGAKLDDEKLNSDGRIIRDHVIMASLSDLSSYNDMAGEVGQGLAWENEATGSRGMISNIQRFNEGERQCRLFKTTRESFDGVMVYEGKACDTPDGGWVLSRLESR